MTPLKLEVGKSYQSNANELVDVVAIAQHNDELRFVGVVHLSPKQDFVQLYGSDGIPIVGMSHKITKEYVTPFETTGYAIIDTNNTLVSYVKDKPNVAQYWQNDDDRVVRVKLTEITDD